MADQPRHPPAIDLLHTPERDHLRRSAQDTTRGAVKVLEDRKQFARLLHDDVYFRVCRHVVGEPLPRQLLPDSRRVGDRRFHFAQSRPYGFHAIEQGKCLALPIGRGLQTLVRSIGDRVEHEPHPVDTHVDGHSSGRMERERDGVHAPAVIETVSRPAATPPAIDDRSARDVRAELDLTAMAARGIAHEQKLTVAPLQPETCPGAMPELDLDHQLSLARG